MEDNKNTLDNTIEVPFVEGAVIEEHDKSTLDSKGRAYATGRRKRSSARVWLKPGNDIKIGKKTFAEYFPCESLRFIALEPLKAAGMETAQIYATIEGGGSVGQAGALRHGIARALIHLDPSLHSLMRSSGYLTRDSRKKERKTPGFRTARKPQQFSKR